MKAKDLCEELAKILQGTKPRSAGTSLPSYETSVGDWESNEPNKVDKIYAAVMVDGDAEDKNSVRISISAQLRAPVTFEDRIAYGQLMGALRDLTRKQ